MAKPVREQMYPHIASDPDVSGGQPVVEGTRIPVATLARAHQSGMDFDEILVQFPSLTPQGLHAALLYYLDHQQEIEALLQRTTEPPDGATTFEA